MGSLRYSKVAAARGQRSAEPVWSGARGIGPENACPIGFSDRFLGLPSIAAPEGLAVLLNSTYCGDAGSRSVRSRLPSGMLAEVRTEVSKAHPQEIRYVNH